MVPVALAGKLDRPPGGTITPKPSTCMGILAVLDQTTPRAAIPIAIHRLVRRGASSTCTGWEGFSLGLGFDSVMG